MPARRKRASDILVGPASSWPSSSRWCWPGGSPVRARPGSWPWAPVVMVSLAVILHPRIGGAATATVLTLSLPGLLGFVAALSALALTVERFGPALALPLALLITLAWNGGILLANRLVPHPFRRPPDEHRPRRPRTPPRPDRGAGEPATSSPGSTPTPPAPPPTRPTRGARPACRSGPSTAPSCRSRTCSTFRARRPPPARRSGAGPRRRFRTRRSSPACAGPAR